MNTTIPPYLPQKDPRPVYKAILQDCERAHPDLTLLEQKMHSILERLPLPDGLHCIQTVAATFKKHHYQFHEEPLVPISIVETEEEIEIPYSLFCHSQAFEAQENEEEPLYISLPWRFTKEDLEVSASFLGANKEPIPGLAMWLRARIVAERFACDEEILQKLASTKPPHLGTLEELETVLFWCEDLCPVIAGSIASAYLQAYIDTSIENNLSMEEICTALKKSPLVQKYINKIPIDLSLKKKTTQDDLETLATVFRSVVSLNIALDSGKTQPTLEIPEALLAHLHEISLTNLTLKDYTVLHKRPNLKKLHLQNIPDITSVPKGCLNLRVFSAKHCHKLQDISGLTRLKSLEECRLEHLPIAEVPSGLSNLKIFYAISCKHLHDISGLNGLRFLQKCRFHELPITTVPFGLSNLKIFSARFCHRLEDIRALNGLQSLEDCIFQGARITAAPSGCPNLKTFHAIRCQGLQDISGLEGLRSLEQCFFIKVPITTAPSNCPNLKVFGAQECPRLQDISNLNNLLSLEECRFYELPLITAAPSGCPNLKIFSAIQCPGLQNISSLSGLQFLEECKFSYIPLITAVPSLCPNLKTFHAKHCPNLRDASGLDDARKLTEYILKNTPIANWKPNSLTSLIRRMFRNTFSIDV